MLKKVKRHHEPSQYSGDLKTVANRLVVGPPKREQEVSDTGGLVSSRREWDFPRMRKYYVDCAEAGKPEHRKQLVLRHIIDH